MIQLGDFIFPPRRTTTQIRMIEAKSKVRKEIRIRSLLKSERGQSIDQQSAWLHYSIETFDRGEAMLSLHPGRFYMGRQRNFQWQPLYGKALAWVDLLILSRDRFERSLDQHSVERSTFFGQTDFTLHHQGNWLAPLMIGVQANDAVDAVHIQTNGSGFTLHHGFAAGETVEIDADARQITLDEKNLLPYAEGKFPQIEPGGNRLILTHEPQTAVVNVTMQFRDVWI